MEENLVGYLLDALEPEERRHIETYLRSRPDARRHLERLRELIQPLATDLEPLDPPSGLWVRTLGKVAEFQCKPLPMAPVVRLRRTPTIARSWFRRADVLVAASIVLVTSMLVPSFMIYMRNRGNIAACQDNLRTFYAALKTYSDHHEGEFPNVATAAPPPRNVAGMVVPILYGDGSLHEPVNIDCATHGRAPRRLTVQQVSDMGQDEFEQCASALTGCYAYSLGYRGPDSRQIQGLRLFAGQRDSEFQALMADRPPVGVSQGDMGNSPNHGGKGQNVLYVDGHCAFKTLRTVGFDGDDIFVNRFGRVAAGVDRHDSVLATGAERP